jgi:hypothetical protein
MAILSIYLPYTINRLNYVNPAGSNKSQNDPSGQFMLCPFEQIILLLKGKTQVKNPRTRNRTTDRNPVHPLTGWRNNRLIKDKFVQHEQKKLPESNKASRFSKTLNV